MLFVPGNNPGMLSDAYIYGSDSIMFDLEDSVSISEKDAARFLVREAIKTINYGGKEIVVRINDPRQKLGIDDLEAIVPLNKVTIRLPKTETAEDILYCIEEINRIEQEAALTVGSTHIIAAIESAKGVLNAEKIANSSKRLVAIALGAEDYVTNMKTNRSAQGTELLFARSMILHAARSAGIDAIDTVYSDIDNEEGLIAETKHIKMLGFDGKSVINPRQINVVHDIFTPSEKAIEYAISIMEAIESAHAKGSGVISLNGKMIDKPIVERAKYTLELAKASGAFINERNLK
jgi:citrate lyase subunit beta/citryl-CoA lyase